MVCASEAAQPGVSRILQALQDYFVALHLEHGNPLCCQAYLVVFSQLAHRFVCLVSVERAKNVLVETSGFDTSGTDDKE